ncbi:unnamed protein product [Fusarium equiseti]|uniref:Uncharacterized protein n=1 Tax=Fusarium equiseti TaxID=61235 RepID=A0A8J2NKV4_FUSEQ|nr:unnamed protein product [Fusarium equiseti]
MNRALHLNPVQVADQSQETLCARFFDSAVPPQNAVRRQTSLTRGLRPRRGRADKKEKQAAEGCQGCLLVGILPQIPRCPVLRAPKWVQFKGCLDARLVEVFVIESAVPSTHRSDAAAFVRHRYGSG